MEKREVIAKLEEVKPMFDSLDNMCSEYTRMEENIYSLNGQKRNKLSGGQIVILILLIPFYVVPAIIYYFIARSLNSKKNEELNKNINSVEQQKSELESRINRQIECIKETGIQEILPGEYLEPVAVKYIYSYLSGGRADSMKEAINLFEEEKHRANMESMQNEYLKQVQIGNKLAAYGNLINAANAINNGRQ